MVPVIKEYEPPKRRLRIQSRTRFIVFLILMEQGKDSMKKQGKHLKQTGDELLGVGS